MLEILAQRWERVVISDPGLEQKCRPREACVPRMWCLYICVRGGEGLTLGGGAAAVLVLSNLQIYFDTVFHNVKESHNS